MYSEKLDLMEKMPVMVVESPFILILLEQLIITISEMVKKLYMIQTATNQLLSLVLDKPISQEIS
jgi:hypothetical protein